MGVQDRDWYWKDREKKERQRERDPSIEPQPKQLRGSRRLKSDSQGTHWLVQIVWWIVAAMTLRLAYLFVITW